MKLGDFDHLDSR